MSLQYKLRWLCQAKGYTRHDVVSWADERNVDFNSAVAFLFQYETQFAAKQLNLTENPESPDLELA